MRPFGFKHSEITKKKIGRANKGKKWTMEQRERLSAIQMGHPAWNKGIPHSEETKVKMREKRKEWLRNNPHPKGMLGKKHSEEGKRKMRLSNNQKIGKESPFWKGGKRISTEGYVYVRQRDHPNSHNNYVSEHRLVMEKKLGRYLEPNEIVHHIDGNKQNNNPKNLYLSTKSKHKLGFGEAYKDGFNAGYSTALLVFLMVRNYEER